MFHKLEFEVGQRQSIICLSSIFRFPSESGSLSISSGFGDRESRVEASIMPPLPKSEQGASLYKLKAFDNVDLAEI